MKALLTACALLFAAAAAQADITITGTGKVKFTPDVAYLSIGVSSDARTAAEAWKLNAEKVKKLFDQLKKLGLTDKDLQTTGVSINPRYDHPKGKPAQLIGYTASYDLSVTVRKLGAVGKVLDAAVDSGAKQSMGIRFECSDPEKLMDKARADAVADARRKAQIYTKGAGAKLRAVVGIHEGSYSPYRTYRFEYEKAMLADASAPLLIAAGEQEMSATVTVTWTIDNDPEA
jgi:uncharacterized protein